MDLSPKCSKCGKIVDFEDLRALGGNKGFVCKECHSGNTPQPRGIDGLKVKKSISDKHFFDKKEFECDKCKYKFTRNADSPVEKCPYCGNTSVRQRIEEYGNRIIED